MRTFSPILFLFLLLQAVPGPLPGQPIYNSRESIDWTFKNYNTGTRWGVSETVVEANPLKPRYYTFFHFGQNAHFLAYRFRYVVGAILLAILGLALLATRFRRSRNQ